MAIFCGTATASGSMGGDVPLIVGHLYVSYTADWVPCSQGTLVDVTAQVVPADDDQSHIFDLHGNYLTVNYSTNTVYDVNAQPTGFVY